MKISLFFFNHKIHKNKTKTKCLTTVNYFNWLAKTKDRVY